VLIMNDEVRTVELSVAQKTYDEVRQRLFGIAYRMLGTVTDAEDVLQEVWLRWQSCDRSVVRDPAAFLATVTTRVSITALSAAKIRRETYIGEWLPSPVDTTDDPTLGAERAEALELAVLVLMEKLTAAERAAYVLREAFVYPYPRIAEIIETSEANARQLVSRARRHLESHEHRPVDRERHRRLFLAFLGAAQDGDVDALESLLADDVVSYTDGNGMHRTARRPVAGKETVTRFLHGVAQWFWDDTELRIVEANGRAMALASRDDRVFAALTATIGAAGVHQVLWVMSPDKLASIVPHDRLTAVP
jgi:RNA polymerase sigma-70 factor (ECF subfamily)